MQKIKKELYFFVYFYQKTCYTIAIRRKDTDSDLTIISRGDLRD